ncbi:MAG: hypothetical protein AVO33_06025 [delta proteobacterium ML8_F1]|nr:MAG: hypothetical protein AVO33_06025 [delta proteobacterium ML8_F1]
MKFTFAPGSFKPEAALSVEVTSLGKDTYDLSVNQEIPPLIKCSVPITVRIPYDGGVDDPVLYHLKDGVWEKDAGYYDKELKVFVGHVTEFSVYAIRSSRGSFEDVTEADWFKDPVEILAGRGVISGKTQESFAPQDAITRGEFTTLMMRSMGFDYVPEAPIFKDVHEEDYYFGSIAAAYETGIVMGTGEGSFNPDAPITRQEMAAMLARGLEYKGHVLRTQDKISFTDEGELAFWAYNPLRLAVSRGIISGYPDGGFGPENPATRAEAAAMIHRFMEK